MIPEVIVNKCVTVKDEGRSTPTWLGFCGIVSAILAAIHIVVARLPWLEAPLQIDGAMWAYAGRRILEGALPYADVWDQKPPGIYYVFAAVAATSGHAVETALIWLDAVVSGALLLLIYAVARHFASRAIALSVLLPASLVLCHRVLADWGLNTEKFAALFETGALLSLLCAASASPSRRRDAAIWLGAGALCGAAAMFRQTGVLMLFAASLGARSLAGGHGGGAGETLRRVVLLWLGALAAWAPVVVYFAAAGLFDDFLRQVVLYDLTRVGSRGGESARLASGEHWRNAWEQGRLAAVLMAPALLGTAWWAGLRARRSAGAAAGGDGRLVTCVWHLGLVLLLFAVSPRGYGHYLLQAVPAAAVICAWALNRARHVPSRVAGIAVIAAALTGAGTLGDHLAFTLHGDNPYRRAYRALRERTLALADTARRHSASSEAVLLWPPDPAASFYAGRRTPLESSNLTIVYRGKIEQAMPPMSELVARLEAAPPAVVVDTTRWRVLREPGRPPGLMLEAGLSLLEEPDDHHPLAEGRALAPLKRWLRANYGGQRLENDCVVYFRGRPWKGWEEFLLAAEPARKTSGA